jgi:hypothetical protein
MSDGGKGSRPRPLSVDQKTFDTNWRRIFNKTDDAVDPMRPSDYQDILSTEDSVLSALEKFKND